MIWVKRWRFRFQEFDGLMSGAGFRWFRHDDLALEVQGSGFSIRASGFRGSGVEGSWFLVSGVGQVAGGWAFAFWGRWVVLRAFGVGG